MSQTKVTPKSSSFSSDIESQEDDTSSSGAPVKKSLSLYSEGDLDIDEEELEKLVPVLLEDASDGNLEAVRQVLDLDAKTPNFSIAMEKDSEGRHALHRASLEGRFEILELLLERYEKTKEKKTGTKYIDVPDKYGNTALFLVCIRLDRSDVTQAKFLLQHGASVEVVKSTDKMTCLHWAAHHGNQELVLELLNHHKRVFAESLTKCKLVSLRDKDNRTPIDVVGLQYAQ
jgi:ankyrin repeat protein